jgi:hypothetical protein
MRIAGIFVRLVMTYSGLSQIKILRISAIPSGQLVSKYRSMFRLQAA